MIHVKHNGYAGIIVSRETTELASSTVLDWFEEYCADQI